VVNAFGLSWGQAQAPAPVTPGGLAARWPGAPLAQAVPGLPSAADLDLSDLSDWTEARAGDMPEAASPRPLRPAAEAGAAQPSDPPATSPRSQAPAASVAVAGVASESGPTRDPMRPADPIESQFSALERACAAIEDALASLRRHLGATDDTYEPGSDPMIADGARLALDTAAAGVATVARTAQALRVATDTLRKVRFDAMTGRLHEYVGCVAREHARPVRWALYGGSEHVDRTLLEKLAEPVEHLLRLSIEHGIEPTLERQQIGKPAAGYVELRVSRQIDGLAIEVSDDGAPLDFSFLRAEARRLGLPALGALPTAEQLETLLSAATLTDARSAQAANPTLRRVAAWARLQGTVRALGGSMELPPETPGRSTVRMVLRD
jgi:chemotaxis protein histidine kinase CheA